MNITLNHKFRSIDVTMKNEKKSSQVLSPKPQHCPLYFEVEVSLGSPVIDVIIYFPLKHSGEMGIYLNMVSLLKKKSEAVCHHAWSPFRQILLPYKGVGFFIDSW